MRIGLPLFLSLAMAQSAQPHDLMDNRATLVLRDRIHISLTLYIVYSDALHAALSPLGPMSSFLVSLSTMKPEQLQRELLRAQSKFQAGTHIHLPGKRGLPAAELTLTNWVWPDVKQVQNTLQTRVMQAVVDPDAHEAPLEIRVDAVAPAPVDISSVTVQFPEEFRKVLVVSYRPNQTWVDPKAPSPEIKF